MSAIETESAIRPILLNAFLLRLLVLFITFWLFKVLCVTHGVSGGPKSRQWCWVPFYILVGFVGWSFVAPLCVGLLIDGNPYLLYTGSHPIQEALAVLVVYGGVLAFLIGWSRYKGLLVAHWVLRRSSPPKLIIIAVMLFALISFGLTIIFLPSASAAHKLAVAASGSVVPLAEEWLYRGVLYSALRKHSNLKVATVTASLIFAVSHHSWDGIGVSLLGGICLCYLFESSGRLWVPVVVHASLNSVAQALAVA